MDNIHRRRRRALRFITLIVALLVGCRLVTLVLVWQAESRYPPVGEFITVGGAPVHVLRAGSGQPVVLLHGNGGQLNDFPPALFETLAARYAVIAPDRPGHGYSARPAGSATLDGQARWLHAVLAALDVQRPLIVGFSWGGALALAYAAAYPNETTGLVLVGKGSPRM